MNVRLANPIDPLLPTAPECAGGGTGSTAVGASKAIPCSDSLSTVFDKVSRLRGNSVAAVCGMEQITYAELNRSGSLIARRLVEMNAEPGSIVAIYLDRSIEMLSAMLGVLKAGMVYLPIDSTYPVARVAQTLEDAQPVVTITDRKLAEKLPALSAQFLFVGDPETADNIEDEIPVRAHGGDVAYLMYTSGSTGKPKGVLVTHQNVLRLLYETQHWFHFNENDVWTMFHSFAFDFSVWEIWGPLLTGGKLIIVPFAVSRSPEDFYALLAEQKVTVLNQTPSAFLLLSRIEEAGGALPLSLRVVIFGGEALKFRALRPWFKRHGETIPQLVNMYGITETTVHVTCRLVSQRDADAEQESLIGVPIPDMQVHLLGDDGQPVADGEVGEICVGGSGVSRGYFNRPELTAARFVPDPFGEPGARLYRSGDLARRRQDGELVYLGRGDGQVKINGFRIELGEVEAAIADHPDVRQVCVVAHADESGSQRLAAYFVAVDGTPLPANVMSSYLSRRLPAQMLPAFYIQLDEMPLTHNGKVDRKELPKPTTGSKAARFGHGSQMQEQVAAIWRNVLAASSVGLEENFFDIGGTSLLLVAVRTELQAQLKRQIPITWMFEFTTVKALAEKLGESDGAGSSANAEVNSASNSVTEQANRQRQAFARMRAKNGAIR